MNSVHSTTAISPRASALLTQVTETPDLETALWKVLSEYIDLKTANLQAQINHFEEKWGMNFAEFSEKLETGALGKDSYEYSTESDFWEWEKAETLLLHYKALQSQWT